ncbi:MAG: hypothetical protein WBB50_06135, partial [Methyloceanibacter sp.]
KRTRKVNFCSLAETLDRFFVAPGQAESIFPWTPLFTQESLSPQPLATRDGDPRRTCRANCGEGKGARKIPLVSQGGNAMFWVSSFQTIRVG